MTVYEIGKTMLKITLTDTEVISCFGAYEKLYTMSYGIQLAINLLLRDIISEHKNFFENSKITAGIKAVKNCGCEITLYCRKSLRNSPKKEYIFCFDDSESLTQAILTLLNRNNTRNLESSLYKMPDCYCLIITSRDANNIFIINEFCNKKSNPKFYAEYVKEYGKPLIINNAINRYGVAFSKYR